MRPRRGSSWRRHGLPSVLALLLVAALLAHTANASRPMSHEQSETLRAVQQSRSLTQQVASSMQRQLQASELCPDGCATGACVAESTSTGLRCQQCKNTLLVSKADGTCGCPAGKFAVNGSEACTDCPKGSWCAGGMYSAEFATPAKVDCPPDMTTLGMRAQSVRSCVNLKGFSYVAPATADGTPSAALCPVDTYSTGLRKQRACVPCPSGMTTQGQTGASSPTACVVPAGFYLKTPGQAVPCPQGEYNADVGANGNCTKCAFGVTTARAGSAAASDCNILLPGYYAAAMGAGGAVTAVAICPQRYICPGGRPLRAFNPDLRLVQPGETTIAPCPDGLWTQELGARAPQQCLVPPGYKSTGSGTAPCAAGEWRAGWKPVAEAGSCNSCGDGVKADKTDRFTIFNIVDGTRTPTLQPVTTSADDCYVQPGQGLYFMSLTQSYRAVNCTRNVFGVANVTYGLTPAPCKECPLRLITSSDAKNYPNSAKWYRVNSDGSGGFTSNAACVTQAGYGIQGRTSEPCEQDSWNSKDSYSSCRKCGFALGTEGVGAGKRIQDCKIKPGYGYGTTQYFNRSLILCPVGTFNDAYQADLLTPCQTCPNGTTTMEEGATEVAKCNLCLPGWGGARCATQCGGFGENATYGPPGRGYGEPCVQCSQQLSVYSFTWQTSNDVWGAPVVSRVGADNAADCLAQYVQPSDAAWYLPFTSTAGVAVTTNVATFDACVQLCNNCQFLTYDYVARNCTVRDFIPAVYEGAPWVGFKGWAAGTAGASSVGSRVRTSSSSNGTTARAKKSDYGQFTLYQDPHGNSIGIQVPAPGAASFTRMQECLEVCEYDRNCAGVIIQSMVVYGTPTNEVGPKSCRLIYGETKTGVFRRTVVRSDPTRLEIPTYLRVCRDLPDPVFHGTWPTSCRGTPVGGSCTARCDCDVEECYSRDGCPVTICQPDGNWGPFVPTACFLGIPAQPIPISCPTPLRSGIYPSKRRRSLLSRTGVDDEAVLQASRASAASTMAAIARHAAAEAMPPAPFAAGSAVGSLQQGRRDLLWAPPSDSFTSMFSGVYRVCPPASSTSPYPNVYLGGTTGGEYVGEQVVDNWLCANYPTGLVQGAAAQDFLKDTQNKFDRVHKKTLEAYAWSRFFVPALPSPINAPPDVNYARLNSLQLMVVGNVGVDSPCYGECSIVAVDVAIFNDGSGEPTDQRHSRLVKLDLKQTFTWSTNETAVLNLDLVEDAQPVYIPDNAYYWLRLKLHAPFNGTDSTGLAKCYAYIAVKDAIKDPASGGVRWQEKGGYNTTCLGVGDSDRDSTPPATGQTLAACANGGAPGATSTGYCTSALQTNTCFGRALACPFPSKDIVYSLYGFNGVENAQGGP